MNDVLAELDDLIRFCRNKNVVEEVITDLNVKTLAYVKKCNKQKTPRNVQITKKYLTEKNLIIL